ncbi:IS607 family transposase [Microseira sp. BLCC-F43]|jgi:predicted site-specific integrase-resolvase|uniref:IS607 family transposase n=1 Tax=Microseira sp. BLCC-F43 TaxID=3153602 RepID=UPI0035B914E0
MMETYRPQKFGELIGKSVSTLQRWDREGILKAHRSPTGRRYYTHDQLLEYLGLFCDEQGKNIVDLRVSTMAQKPDLKNQKAAVACYCQSHNIQVDDWVEEIASGLNYKRPKLSRIFEDIELGRVKKLIIAHKDRLVRFGFEWFEGFCNRHGTKIIIVNGEQLSPEQELVTDLLSIVHIFSARI